MLNVAPPVPPLAEVLAIARTRWYMLLIAVALPMLAGLAIAAQLPAKYEATSKILVRPGREFMPQTETTADRIVASPVLTMQETTSAEIEILRSADIRDDVVRQMLPATLYPDLAAPPSPWQAVLAALRNAVRSGATALLGRDTPPPAVAADPVALAVDALAADLAVQPEHGSNVIGVSLRNTSRATALDALRRFLAAYEDHHIAAFGRHQSASLEQQIAARQAQMAGLERERAAIRADDHLFSVPEQRVALVQQRSHTVADLQDVQTRKAFLQQQIMFLRESIAAQPATVTLETVSAPSAVAGETERRLHELTAQEQSLLARYPPGSPFLDASKAAIAAMQKALASNAAQSQSVRTALNPLLTGLQSQILTVGAELAPLDAKAAALNASIAAIERELNRLGEGELRLLGIERRLSQIEVGALALNKQLQESRALDEFDHARISSISIIEAPSAAHHPVVAGKPLLLAGGAAAGLFAAVFVLLLALTFRTRLLTPQAVELALNLPVLAVVARPARVR